MTIHRHAHPLLALKSRPWLLWAALSAALAVAAIWTWEAL